MSGDADRVKDMANRISADDDADVILINAPFFSAIGADLPELIRGRKQIKPKVYVILITEGGLADVAYRTCRSIQMKYDEVVVVIPGWCKSAGTLFCVGANRLIFGEQGELGPIDVQLRRPDEIGERDSGLAVDSAFDALYRASFKMFEGYMLGLKKKSYGAVTFKTAADIAAQITIGLVQPILAQLDPIKVG
ncbi:hypothetical protein [uncultured Enterovirga sp.]|uniref:SDH family Clp fold serine proteinase n=1 Tax=uncultured Enterovirga sp. TaxID=2026352 RepID=UPI0035CACEBE